MCDSTNPPLRSDALTCEFQVDPASIDQPRPRLGWQFEDVRLASLPRGKKQTAYRVLVASSPDLLARDEGDLWDSGKVESPASQHVAYGGTLVASRTHVWWKVKAWDEEGREGPWSVPASWTTGILSPEEWDAHSAWVGLWDEIAWEDRYPISVELENVAPGFRAAARKFHPKGPGPENDYARGLYLRRVFELELPAARVQRALVRVAGLGYHELSLNGQKVDDRVLVPAATDYTKRVYYHTYDVTALVSAPKNCLGIVLGGGWFFPGTPDLFGFDRAAWVAPPRVRAELEIEYETGARQYVGTDEHWHVTADGPLRFNCVRSGEVYDARQELPGWDEPGTVTSSEPWQPARRVTPPAGVLQARTCPDMKVHRSIAPSHHTTPAPGVVVYHFPENVAGWVQISVRGQAGQRVLLKLNEKLTPEGTVDMDAHSGHTYGRFQTCEYTCKGTPPGSVETWHPRFCYQGFQFVQIEGIPAAAVEAIEAQFVHTAVPRTGEFEASDPLLNQIDVISRRTFLNGLHGYPEDCPQREKAGWTEDGVISCRGAVYNFDCGLSHAKWARDLVDAQDASGQVPDIVPTPGWGRPGESREVMTMIVGRMADPWWGGAIVHLPWILYRQYGDAAILAECFPAIERYMAFLSATAEDDHLIRWHTLLGDWLEVGSGGSAARTPKILTATQAYYYYATLAAKIARLVDKEARAAEYDRLAEEIRASFNQEFLDEDTGWYHEDSQSAQALSLFLGLVPEELETKVVDRLVENIRETRDGHLSTGIVGSYFLYHALARFGRPEVALEVITARGFPGFEYMLSHESPLHGPTTTLWEDWPGKSSLAHPVQGCVVSFFHE